MSNLHPFPGSSSAPQNLPLPFDPAMAPAPRCRILHQSLPEPLRQVIDQGRIERHSRFSEEGFADVVETWTPPEGMTPRHAALARRALAEIDETILAPAPANHLLGRVLALLSHFPAKATTPEVEQLLAMDWADDLGEFPAWAIDHAARRWRRTRKWRPSIAEIRALCEEACAGERALADRLRAIALAGERLGETGHGSGDFRPMLASALRRMW
ncbi:hypothetical protein AZL_c00010 (plasmid) [Azospirillum sp. B510]|uniref:hypothetical protein n=1 Tax=Azospirillum sp. (strain B510) TaxID=137722 RepID=UPI0001C4CAAF|nr:hypothetical protein [Azospirillum sp. B510]BAI75294.1 hypothetical protein AZL_c00010 [Azospirillum sp. B510]